MLTFFRLLALCALLFSQPLFAEIKGRVDIGAALVSIDILESGKTEDTIDMKAIKGDGTIAVWRGICLKPGFLIGSGHGEIASASIGVGHYTPITDDFAIVPLVGITFTYLRTKVDFEDFNLFDLKERFRSSSPYVGLEFSYRLSERWSLIGLYQYAWSRTHTKIKPIVSSKSHSNGPNYGLAIEYSLNCNWAISLGAGYNITLSKEKHGLRGKGAKLGVAYYF